MECEYILTIVVTTDKGILNKAKRIALLRVANPMELIGEI